MAIAKSDRILFDGYNLACAFKSVLPTAQAEELDATVLCSDYRAYQAGFKSGSTALSGVWEHDGTNLDKIHNVLSSAFDSGAAKAFTASIGLFAVGSDAVMMDGCTVKYAIPMPVGELIMSEADLRSNDGMNFGKFLMSAQLNAGTTNGTSIDNGAATTNGGLFHVHLNNDTASDVDTKVQHSTDNSTWVDLTSVNNLSATHASGSATVSSGTTVNRYLRAVSVVTGGNTILVSAAFARR